MVDPTASLMVPWSAALKVGQRAAHLVGLWVARTVDWWVANLVAKKVGWRAIQLDSVKVAKLVVKRVDC